MMDQAFILAAGKGERMRPLTDTCPKPLVEVNGKPIIDYALDSLAAHGIKRCVVNAHYQAQMLQDHIKGKKLPFEIIISHEPTLLDTGGGLKAGLKHLDADKPLLVLSGDSILMDPPQGTSLDHLAAGWDPARMDILLLLQPVNTMVLTQGVGDYDMVVGKPVRSQNRRGEYMWTSARILNPRIFDAAPDGAFSFLPMMDAAQQAGRLSAQIHQGLWHHLTTPEDVKRVNMA